MVSHKGHSRGVRRCTFAVFPSRHLKSFTLPEGGRNLKGYRYVDKSKGAFLQRIMCDFTLLISRLN